MIPEDLSRRVDGRLHGLEVRLGEARAAVRRVEALEHEHDLFQRNDFAEVGKLVDADG